MRVYGGKKPPKAPKIVIRGSFSALTLSGAALVGLTNNVKLILEGISLILLGMTILALIEEEK